MTRKHSAYPYEGDARHSTDWHDQRGEVVPLEPGERFFVPCVGGPSTSRLEVFPPQLEVEERDGTYVLVDDGPREEWHYLFVPHTP